MNRLTHSRPHGSTTSTRPAGASPRRAPALEHLEDRVVPAQYEVWAIDQSGTAADGSGGTVHIYQGHDLADGRADDPAAVDLAAMIPGPAVRPHMINFNSTGSHAIVAYVGTGHVLFVDAAARAPVGVIDVGVQAHAATPSPDDSFVIVADQNGKKLHRIRTDYAGNVYTLDATLDLLPLQDPVGQPDTAPICPVVDSSGRYCFVTLRGGGLFVVDTASMTLIAEYPAAVVHPDGCGGAEAGGKVYINSGGARSDGTGHADLYAFDLAAIGAPPKLVFSQDGPGVDAHGTSLVKHGRYLWTADRWANRITVVDTATDTVVNTIPLAGAVSGDPAPDLMVTSPDGSRVYVTLRGPIPLTANNPAVNNARGSTPGVGIIKVTEGGRGGELVGVAPINHVVAGVERADPHGIALRVLTPAGPPARAAGAGGGRLGAAGTSSPVSEPTLLLGYVFDPSPLIFHLGHEGDTSTGSERTPVPAELLIGASAGPEPAVPALVTEDASSDAGAGLDLVLPGPTEAGEEGEGR